MYEYMYIYIYVYVCTSHTTHVEDSCQTYCMCHSTRMNKTRRAHTCFTPPIHVSHITCVNKSLINAHTSCHMYGSVMSHV